MLSLYCVKNRFKQMSLKILFINYIQTFYLHYSHSEHCTLILLVGRCTDKKQLDQTKGKKKSKGSLTLIVGVALKPGTAAADTSLKVTELLIDRKLSPPDNRSCGTVRHRGRKD